MAKNTVSIESLDDSSVTDLMKGSADVRNKVFDQLVQSITNDKENLMKAIEKIFILVEEMDVLNHDNTAALYVFFCSQIAKWEKAMDQKINDFKSVHLII